MKIYVVRMSEYDDQRPKAAFSQEIDAYAYIHAYDEPDYRLAVEEMELDADIVERDPDLELGPMYKATVQLFDDGQTSYGKCVDEWTLRHPTETIISIDGHYLSAFSPRCVEDATMAANLAVDQWRRENPDRMAEHHVRHMRSINQALSLIASPKNVVMVVPDKDKILTTEWITTINHVQGPIRLRWTYGRFFTIEMGDKGVAYSNHQSALNMMHACINVGLEAFR